MDSVWTLINHRAILDINLFSSSVAYLMASTNAVIIKIKTKILVNGLIPLIPKETVNDIPIMTLIKVKPTAIVFCFIMRSDLVVDIFNGYYFLKVFDIGIYQNIYFPISPI